MLVAELACQTDPVESTKPTEFADKLKQIREEEQRSYECKVAAVHEEYEIRKQELERTAETRVARAKAECNSAIAFKDEDMTDLHQKIERLHAHIAD